jgi:hypothetical protein
VVTPLVVVFAGLDESERHGGRNLNRLRPMRSYTYLGIVDRVELGGDREADGVLPIPISARG